MKPQLQRNRFTLVQMAATLAILFVCVWTVSCSSSKELSDQLLKAIDQDDANQVAVLLKRGANPDQPGTDGAVPMKRAAMRRLLGARTTGKNGILEQLARKSRAHRETFAIEGAITVQMSFVELGKAFTSLSMNHGTKNYPLAISRFETEFKDIGDTSMGTCAILSDAIYRAKGTLHEGTFEVEFLQHVRGGQPGKGMVIPMAGLLPSTEKMVSSSLGLR